MVSVVKIGGNIIDNPANLARFLVDFAAIDGFKVLIHGGGKIATQLAEKLHIPQQMVHGRRITDQDTLDVVTMVYAGLINKNIVADLLSMGTKAIGVCGADGDLINAVRRPAKEVDYGYVGDVIKVRADLLAAWFGQGLSPVIAPITHDGMGQLLNTNADTIASEIAISLSKIHPVRLIYCFEKQGVLMDVDDPSSVIPKMNEEKFDKLKAQGLIHSGMLPKLENAIQTVKNGVESVIIGHAEALPDIIQGKSGTKISL